MQAKAFSRETATHSVLMVALRRGYWLLLAAAIVIAGAGYMFSNFQPYDDEGYMYYAIRAFTAHGGLYDRVDSQYGPFFHLVHQGLNLLGLPFTSNSGRGLMLFYWLVTVGFCGAIVWRLTRSTAATAFTLGGAFVHLTTFVNEPTHPGGMIAVLVAGLAWFGVSRPDRPAQLAVAAGAIGAALLLTKINVGIFVFAGAGAWWLLHLPAGPPGWRVPAWIAGLLLAVLPLALMGEKLAAGWVATFAFVVVTSSTAVLLVTARGAPLITHWGNLLPLAGGAGAVALISVAGVMAHDTSLHAILRGVLLNPMRHPGLFMIPVEWQTGTWLAASIALGCALMARKTESESVRRLVAAGRLLAVAAFGVFWISPRGMYSGIQLYSYGIAFAWLFVFPLDGDRPRASARAWIALLLVTQALHAYPVAGSQLAWGSFLLIPLAVAGAHEAWGALGLRCWPRFPRLSVLAGLTLMGLTLYGTATRARYGRNLIVYGAPLNAPGSTWVRLPASQASTFRVLNLNARAHSDVLFTFPGQLSLNDWSQVPAPTLHNNTHWFTLLSQHNQNEIRRKLEASPRSAVIFQREELVSLAKRGVATETPLAKWLREAYEPAFEVGPYEFRVRQGRRIAALGTAVARREANVHVIAATLTLPDGQPFAAVELHRFKGIITEKIAHWSGAEMNLQLTLAKEPAAPGQQIFRVEFAAAGFPPDLPPSDSILYFIDATGKRVAEARLL